MSLALVCVASLAIGLVGLRRPAIPIVISLLLLAFLPAVASGLLTSIDYESSGGPSVHPATWVVGFTLVLRVLREPRAVFSSLTDPRGSWLLLASFACVMTFTINYLERGGAGLSQWAETLVGPFFLAALVHMYVHRNEAARKRLLLGVYIGACVIALYSVTELLFQRDLLYTHALADADWRQTVQGAYRAPSTLGHPLLAANVFAAVIPLGRQLRSSWFLLGSLTLLVGILATASRAAILIVVGYLLVFALVAGVRRWGMVLVLGVSIYLLVFFTAAGAVLRDRFAFDFESSTIRLQSWPVVFHEIGNFVLTGSGFGTSEALSSAILGRDSSLENGILMWVVDVGLLSTVFILAAIIGLALQGGFRRTDGYVLAGLVGGLAMAASYSSFGVKSVAAYLPWLLASLCLKQLQPKSGEETKRVHLESVSSDFRGLASG